MTEKIQFKQRVAQIAMDNAHVYQDVLMQYEYLFCSPAFTKHPYYILAAKADNYLHLFGIHAHCSPQTFFDKCITGTLNEEDFDFSKSGKSEKEIKGTVRRKIRALPSLMAMFDGKPLVVQEDFRKNGIFCSFASTDQQITIGFSRSNITRPMSLLAGNMLDPLTSCGVELLLRRVSGTKQFDQIVIGNEQTLQRYLPQIAPLADIPALCPR